jgi:hypothetical protein
MSKIQTHKIFRKHNTTAKSLINVSYPFWHLVWKRVELEPSPPKKNNKTQPLFCYKAIVLK